METQTINSVLQIKNKSIKNTSAIRHTHTCIAPFCWLPSQSFMNPCLPKGQNKKKGGEKTWTIICLSRDNSYYLFGDVSFFFFVHTNTPYKHTHCLKLPLNLAIHAQAQYLDILTPAESRLFYPLTVHHTLIPHTLAINTSRISQNKNNLPNARFLCLFEIIQLSKCIVLLENLFYMKLIMLPIGILHTVYQI